MSVTQDYKLFTLSPENGVVAVTRSVFVLKLVNESEIQQLLNDVKKLAKASHADGAVDITVLVSYSDLHALGAHILQSGGFGVEDFDDIGVKVCFLVAGEGGHYSVPHSLLSYFGKYAEKESVAGGVA